MPLTLKNFYVRSFHVYPNVPSPVSQLWIRRRSLDEPTTSFWQTEFLEHRRTDVMGSSISKKFKKSANSRLIYHLNRCRINIGLSAIAVVLHVPDGAGRLEMPNNPFPFPPLVCPEEGLVPSKFLGKKVKFR